jgi:tetratricopeptide (TPR) repeat protein
MNEAAAFAKSSGIAELLASTKVDDWIEAARQASASPRIAIAILEEASERFDSLGVIHDLARLAERASEWSKAEDLWNRFLAKTDSVWWAHTSLAACLYKLDRAREAEEVFANAERCCSDKQLIQTEHLRILIDAGHLQQIPALIEAALREFPSWRNDQLAWMGQAALAAGATPAAILCGERLSADPNDTRVGGFIAALKHALSEADPTSLARFESATPHLNAVDTAKLLMRFESLGGDYPGLRNRFGPASPWRRASGAAALDHDATGGPYRRSEKQSGGHWRAGSDGNLCAWRALQDQGFALRHGYADLCKFNHPVRGHGRQNHETATFPAPQTA